MSDGLLEMKQTTEPADDAELIERAKAVLEANWLGHATSPNRRLYPHQWSWDAACIAIGYAPWNQERAETELRSLFAGQWRNGLLPHIVFTDGARYFPGPDFWQTERSPDAPASPRTSGIVQPPIHATAALAGLSPGERPGSGGRLPRGALAEARGLACVPLPGACSSRGRSRRDLASLGIRHGQLPALGCSARTHFVRQQMLPKYERVDVDVAEATERPSDGEYDRYVYLVSLFRELGTTPRG